MFRSPPTEEGRSYKVLITFRFMEDGVVLIGMTLSDLEELLENEEEVSIEKVSNALTAISKLNEEEVKLLVSIIKTIAAEE